MTQVQMKSDKIPLACELLYLVWSQMANKIRIDQINWSLYIIGSKLEKRLVAWLHFCPIQQPAAV